MGGVSIKVAAFLKRSSLTAAPMDGIGLLFPRCSIFLF